MEYHVFLEQVQQEARLSTQTQAADVVRSTLQALGERLAGGVVDNLAAQLPRILSHYLYAPAMMGQGHSSSLHEFYRMIHEHEGVEFSESVCHAKAVILVLCRTVPSPTIKDVLSQLPREYHPLFETDTSEEEGTKMLPFRV